MLVGLLLTLNVLICIALVGVVLLQPSEGGAFGGGSPTGLMTARGRGNLLTRTTWTLFCLFLAISLTLTLLGGHQRSSQAILERLKSQSINPDALAAAAKSPPANASQPPVAPAQTAKRAPGLGAPTPTINLPGISGGASPDLGPPPPTASRSAPSKLAP
jgi:preprotein translocase subunit SecG